jgi:iron complex transport system ATP-binding protein
MKSSILETHDLAIGYHSRMKKTSIVEGLNLRLWPGQLTCLIGPNGTGKSTLLRTLAGLQKPVKGSVMLTGESLSHFTPEQLARKIGIVLTDAPHPGDLSVNQVVELGRLPYTDWLGNLTQTDRSIASHSLELVKAASLSGRNFGELSDGERQKVMIARALAQQPDLLILDEPTAFLDWPNRVDLLFSLKEIAFKEKKTILISSHDLELVLQIADEVWAMDVSGTIIPGTGHELLQNGTLEKIFSSRYASFFKQKICLSGILEAAGNKAGEPL